MEQFCGQIRDAGYGHGVVFRFQIILLLRVEMGEPAFGVLIYF